MQKLRDQREECCLISLLKADSFVFAQRGLQSKQVLRDRSEILRKGDGNWGKSELGGRRADKAHKGEKEAGVADCLSKTENIVSLCTSFWHVNPI